MKVKELIIELKKLDPERDVLICDQESVHYDIGAVIPTRRIFEGQEIWDEDDEQFETTPECVVLDAF